MPAFKTMTELKAYLTAFNHLHIVKECSRAFIVNCSEMTLRTLKEEGRVGINQKFSTLMNYPGATASIII